MNKNVTVVLLLVLAAGCSSTPQYGAHAPPMEPTRKVSEQDCSGPIDTDGGNLMCRGVLRPSAAPRSRKRAAGQGRRETEERAARERLERERAEQLAREEAARKQRAAEEERLAAESRLLEAEAARKARKSASVRRGGGRSPCPPARRAGSA